MSSRKKVRRSNRLLELENESQKSQTGYESEQETPAPRTLRSTAKPVVTKSGAKEQLQQPQQHSRKRELTLSSEIKLPQAKRNRTRKSGPNQKVQTSAGKAVRSRDKPNPRTPMVPKEGDSAAYSGDDADDSTKYFPVRNRLRLRDGSSARSAAPEERSRDSSASSIRNPQQKALRSKKKPVGQSLLSRPTNKPASETKGRTLRPRHSVKDMGKEMPGIQDSGDNSVVEVAFTKKKAVWKGSRSAKKDVALVPDKKTRPEDWSYPCRRNEFMEISEFLEKMIKKSTGGCIHISGMPGTGKTATVHQVIKYLQSHENELPPFDVCEINGMKLSDPKQAYVVLAKAVFKTKKVVGHAKALALLDQRYRSPEVKKTTMIALVDEMDLLYAKKQKVLYNLFEWPQLQASHLVVVSIANTMDLPEKLLIARIESRLGMQRLAFQPYTSAQLEQVVRYHLKDATLSEDAMLLASKRVAGISGDARRVLDISKRARNIAAAKCQRAHKGPISVQLADVVAACDELLSSPKFVYMKSASTLEKFFLKAVVSEYDRTGTEEAEIGRVIGHVMDLCSGTLVSRPTVSMCLSMAHRLASVELLFMETKSTGMFQRRLSLNCSVDDVKFATEN